MWMMFVVVKMFKYDVFSAFCRGYKVTNVTQGPSFQAQTRQYA